MILPEHELKVVYPYGGKHFLLLWRGYNGSQIILGRSEKSIENIFQTLLQREVPQIQQYLQINIVAPSDYHKQLYADRKLENEVINFWSYFSFMAKEYYNKFNRFPNKLERCKLLPFDDEDYHCRCARCFGTGIGLTEGNIKEFYLQVRSLYLREEKYTPEERIKYYYSRAEVCDSSSPVYTACFSSGVVLKEIKKDYIDNSILFFYQNPIVLNMEAIEELDRADREKRILRDIEKKKLFQVQREKEEEQKFQQLLRYFD